MVICFKSDKCFQLDRFIPTGRTIANVFSLSKDQGEGCPRRSVLNSLSTGRVTNGMISLLGRHDNLFTMERSTQVVVKEILVPR